ncbi:glycoside hydrolase [Fomitiporia mediterranea MF3/22]|uniref:glycoside hydrolase n=1 Tax=Fomitiporia mediterranea (strain MF3/22) TaxID=694068 RepID=UPI00044097D6|nr:glycoside hydrolase [Fomitiporia mediterranea MF3/22]EJD05308.1 glycoside hydrolase [Fomitiporia mediterranea MF3/22]
MHSGILIALCSAALVTAHGGVLQYSFGGDWYNGFVPYNTPTGQSTIQRQWATYNPITDPTDPTIACNDPGTTTDPQLTATVPAGTSITAYWNNPWPHAIGPMMIYMANCGGDCTDADPTSLNWFKIDESGLLNGTVADGFWGSGLMIQQNSSWTSTIPAALPNGNYMIRHETLAIHTANQPQFYMECAQLTITGGGSGTPSPTVKFPGAYSMDDPSINIDVYSSTATTYAIPGPSVWTG